MAKITPLPAAEPQRTQEMASAAREPLESGAAAQEACGGGTRLVKILQKNNAILAQKAFSKIVAMITALPAAEPQRMQFGDPPLELTWKGLKQWEWQKLDAAERHKFERLLLQMVPPWKVLKKIRNRLRCGSSSQVSECEERIFDWAMKYLSFEMQLEVKLEWERHGELCLREPWRCESAEVCETFRQWAYEIDMVPEEEREYPINA